MFKHWFEQIIKKEVSKIPKKGKKRQKRLFFRKNRKNPKKGHFWPLFWSIFGHFWPIFGHFLTFFHIFSKNFFYFFIKLFYFYFLTINFLYFFHKTFIIFLFDFINPKKGQKKGQKRAKMAIFGPSKKGPKTAFFRVFWSFFLL